MSDYTLGQYVTVTVVAVVLTILATLAVAYVAYALWLLAAMEREAVKDRAQLLRELREFAVEVAPTAK